jgi:hypothetical protein
LGRAVGLGDQLATRYEEDVLVLALPKLDLDLDSIGAIGRNDENDVIAESKVLFDLLPRVVFAFRVMTLLMSGCEPLALNSTDSTT